MYSYVFVIPMPQFMFVISHNGKNWQLQKPHEESPVLGKKIGETFGATFLGLDSYELTITGGSDKDGFPMRKDIEGVVRKRLLVSAGTGYRGANGVKRRKTLRGNTIAGDIVQVNCTVAKAGAKALEEILGPPKAKEKKEALGA